MKPVLSTSPPVPPRLLNSWLGQFSGCNRHVVLHPSHRPPIRPLLHNSIWTCCVGWCLTYIIINQLTSFRMPQGEQNAVCCLIILKGVKSFILSCVVLFMMPLDTTYARLMGVRLCKSGWFYKARTRLNFGKQIMFPTTLVNQPRPLLLV